MYEPSKDSNYPRGANNNLYSRVKMYYSTMPENKSVFDIKDSELRDFVKEYLQDSPENKAEPSEVLKVIKIYILMVDNEKNNQESR